MTIQTSGPHAATRPARGSTTSRPGITNRPIRCCAHRPRAARVPQCVVLSMPGARPAARTSRASRCGSMIPSFLLKSPLTIAGGADTSGVGGDWPRRSKREANMKDQASRGRRGGGLSRLSVLLEVRQSRGVYGGIPVCRGLHPHAFEKCDSCLTVCNERGQS